ncbi:glycosyltransferase [Natronosporangium hydrolyticum]|uniref:Glycosyltransferase n=1 Tax=Natronosporangium hydrolyticum TaxID=2811111 RepID=A0A895YBS8_9ACTN|nr:glycosyltransferase family 2 protein [Natronosporangium hydrolyticum]QSB12903.1 glycosyltransferase [Natronosporangium hydrolyticum]
MNPLVSVVVPNYNGEKTLAACLAAVAAQTYPALEVIVIDDASTDRSREIAAGFDCTLVNLPENSGPAVARNRGIAASRGEILFFLDADVALAPDAVATAVRILQDRPELAGASGVYSTTPLFDDGPVERYQVLHAHYWRARNAGLVKAGYFSLGAFRREVIAEVGGFDDHLPANFNEDTEYGYRIAQRHPMLLTTGIRGHHDDDDRLLPIMRKFYRRVSSVVPLVLAERGRGTTGEMAHRPREVVTAGLTLGLLVLAPLSTWLLLGALASLVAFACAEPRMVRFVRREAGLRFIPFFLTVHFVLNVTVGVAAAVGLLRYAASPSFRRLYQHSATPTAATAT